MSDICLCQQDIIFKNWLLLDSSFHQQIKLQLESMLSTEDGMTF